jgi:Mitochondrial carrier protein
MYSSALHCARTTVAREGVPALFKGCLPPLASAPLINAITFAAYVQTSKVGHRWRCCSRRGAIARSVCG